MLCQYPFILPFNHYPFSFLPNLLPYIPHSLRHLLPTAGGDARNNIHALPPSCTCFPLQVVTHEVGHNFGLQHGSIRDPFTAVWSEYGDNGDIMGGASPTVGGE